MEQSSQIDTFSGITQVSRETITSLKKYEEYLIKSNKTLNLIGKSTVNQIGIRHFLDSSQVIDFIEENDIDYVHVPYQFCPDIFENRDKFLLMTPRL